MARSSLSELIEAIGAVLVVVGLVFWSLPLALITAGLFLVAVANAPGRPGPGPSAGTAGRAGRVDRRATSA